MYVCVYMYMCVYICPSNHTPIDTEDISITLQSSQVPLLCQPRDPQETTTVIFSLQISFACSRFSHDDVFSHVLFSPSA